ncbi:hypothetical protein [Membranihabitans marinus]|uniref:hypothetical protein n=1 Tax=Membranihabitans marinus TaxID=1227546 RepID=UPI001F33FD46|nr:hypothetical protein [Membranihabitans marinus]
MNNFKLLEKKTLENHRPLSNDLKRKISSEISLMKFMAETIDLLLPKTLQTITTFLVGEKPLDKKTNDKK